MSNDRLAITIIIIYLTKRLNIWYRYRLSYDSKKLKEKKLLVHQIPHARYVICRKLVTYNNWHESE